MNSMVKALGLILIGSFATLSPLRAGTLEKGKLHAMGTAIETAIDEGHLPGAVLWVEHKDDHFWHAYGNRSITPTDEEMTRDTIFDMASLTKVVATTPAVMLLVERGEIKPFARAYPESIPQVGGTLGCTRMVSQARNLAGNTETGTQSARLIFVASLTIADD